MKNFNKKLGGTVAFYTSAIALVALIITSLLLAPSQRPLEPAIKATVEIRTQVLEEGSLVPNGSGSGVVIDKRGYIVTCWHVVADTNYVVVEWEGIHAIATVVAHDAGLDLALLKVEREMSNVAQWGNSDRLLAGDTVFAIGYPFDITRLIRRGVIASTDFVIEDGSFLVTDAQVNPGDSGGGLFTEGGQLIGIDARLQSVQGLGANIGLAYAITGNIAHYFVLQHLPKAE